MWSQRQVPSLLKFILLTVEAIVVMMVRLMIRVGGGFIPANVVACELVVVAIEFVVVAVIVVAVVVVVAAGVVDEHGDDGHEDGESCEYEDEGDAESKARGTR